MFCPLDLLFCFVLVAAPYVVCPRSLLYEGGFNRFLREYMGHLRPREIIEWSFILTLIWTDLHSNISFGRHGAWKIYLATKISTKVADWQPKFQQKLQIGYHQRKKKDKREKFIDPCSNIYTKINTCHISFLPSTLKEEVWWLNINWFKMLWKSLIPIFQLTSIKTCFSAEQ